MDGYAGMLDQPPVAPFHEFFAQIGEFRLERIGVGSGKKQKIHGRNAQLLERSLDRVEIVLEADVYYTGTAFYRARHHFDAAAVQVRLRRMNEVDSFVNSGVDRLKLAARGADAERGDIYPGFPHFPVLHPRLEIEDVLSRGR